MTRIRRKGLNFVGGMVFLLFERSVLFAGGQEQLAGARVYGQVFLTTPSASLSATRWDLARTVIYLVPLGHSEGIAPPSLRHLVIAQKKAQFQPPFLVIAKGQTVDFVNDDNVDHNVFSISKIKKFDLGIYPKGESKSVTFDQEGPILTFCSVHETMNGAIYVVPNSLFALADAQGQFSMSGVPVGKYKVYTWHPALPEHVKYLEVRTIDVQSNKPIRVDIDLAKLSNSQGDL